MILGRIKKGFFDYESLGRRFGRTSFVWLGQCNEFGEILE